MPDLPQILIVNRRCRTCGCPCQTHHVNGDVPWCPDCDRECPVRWS